MKSSRFSWHNSCAAPDKLEIFTTPQFSSFYSSKSVRQRWSQLRVVWMHMFVDMFELNQNLKSFNQNADLARKVKVPLRICNRVWSFFIVFEAHWSVLSLISVSVRVSTEVLISNKKMKILKFKSKLEKLLWKPDFCSIKTWKGFNQNLKKLESKPEKASIKT